MSTRAPGLYVIFDGPPGAESGRFIEVEDERGRSVGMDGRLWEEDRWIGHPSSWRLGPFGAASARLAEHVPVIDWTEETLTCSCGQRTTDYRLPAGQQYADHVRAVLEGTT